MSLKRLTYKGDGDYDLIVGRTEDVGNDIVVRLSYDGSDYAVGEWEFWGLVIDGHDIGGRQIITSGALLDWLESAARVNGKLPDEPQSTELLTKEAQ